MTQMPTNVLAAPAEPWLDRLRRGHHVWCVKQNCKAAVVWAWEPPAPGIVTCTGRIGIQPIVDNHVQSIQQWYCTVHGQGIDKSQILLPIQDNLPDEPSPISEPVVRQLMRSIAMLTTRVELLETRLTKLRERLFLGE